MLSIKMRAAKEAGSQKPKRGDQYSKRREVHISGAEGIYKDADAARIVGEYAMRAMHHPRGGPDRIVITVEKMRQKPFMTRTLPVTTLKCRSVPEAQESISRILAASGISEKAVKSALGVVYGEKTMRGASLICAGSGKRIEPDRKRGVRATCLGITDAAERSLSALLSKEGLNNTTVKEALVLASKVAACSLILAELCVSDDPDYTTGYVSSRRYGYVRIPGIKRRGISGGGRVFFVGDNADRGAVTCFLEETPLLVNRTSPVRGTRSIDEIIDCHNL